MGLVSHAAWLGPIDESSDLTPLPHQALQTRGVVGRKAPGELVVAAHQATLARRQVGNETEQQVTADPRTLVKVEVSAKAAYRGCAADIDDIELVDFSKVVPASTVKSPFT